MDPNSTNSTFDANEIEVKTIFAEIMSKEEICTLTGKEVDKDADSDTSYIRRMTELHNEDSNFTEKFNETQALIVIPSDTEESTIGSEGTPWEDQTNYDISFINDSDPFEKSSFHYEDSFYDQMNKKLEEAEKLIEEKSMKKSMKRKRSCGHAKDGSKKSKTD